MTACHVGLGLVIVGVVVLFAVRLFVDRLSTFNDIEPRIERSGRVPLPLLGASMLAVIGGAVFLAVDGC